MAFFLLGVASNDVIINGSGLYFTRYSGAHSMGTEGQNGRKLSRYLTLALIISLLSSRSALIRMDRLPKARGPLSILPWNQPTILLAARSSAVASSIFSTWSAGMRR